MLKLLRNRKGQIGMVGAAVGLFITLIIAVLVYYNIAASVDTTTIDAGIGIATSTPALNATTATNNQAATFFTIAPIIGIVIVAVVILNYVQRIGG